jgi:hypothetical protein
MGGANSLAAMIDDAVDRQAANSTLAALFYGRDLLRRKDIGSESTRCRAGLNRSAQPGTIQERAAHRLSDSRTMLDLLKPRSEPR